VPTDARDLPLRIAGLGRHLPGPCLDWDDVRRILRRHPDGLSESAQEQLLKETGTIGRHYAIDFSGGDRSESNTSMAAAAGRRALAAAGWTPADVELLVVTTVVPDHLMPPTSTLVQEALGIPECLDIEISANCTAPYKGLLIAADALRSGRVRRALVCSSQYISFLGFPPWACPERMGPAQGALRWIVSDGAGAWALERAEPDSGLRVWSRSGGVGKRAGMSLPFGAADPDVATLHHRGAQHVSQDMHYVLKTSLRYAPTALRAMLKDLDLDGERIDHFIPAVSSMQIAEKFQDIFARECGIRPDAWRMNFTRVGYLGGVTLPVVLSEMTEAGTLRPGDLVCSFAEESSKWMCAGAALRWPRP
jgi:3-oxoacyl-[acyl-carrier-protein] synthase-3